MAQIPPIIDLTPDGERRGSFTIRLRKRSDGRQTQYWARRNVPTTTRTNRRNPYVWRALQTTDPEKAKAAAWKWLFSIEGKLSAGRSVRVPTFRQAAHSWLKLLDGRQAQYDDQGQPTVRPSKYRRREQCVRRYLIPFFGDKPITEIGTDECDRWTEWRQNYFTEYDGKLETEVVYQRGGKTLKLKKKRSVRPAASTIQKDIVAFNDVIEHARVRMGVRFDIVPKLPSMSEYRDTRRPRFDPDEWRTLAQALQRRADVPIAEDGSRNGRPVKGGPLSVKSKWSRIMLNCFCQFLHGTGIRVSEAMYLQVSDLVHVAEDEEANLQYAAELRAVSQEFDTQITENEREAKIKQCADGRFEYRIEVRETNPGIKQRIHARRIIPLTSIHAVIDQLLFHLLINLPRNVKGDARSPTELPADLWLWCDPDGSRIRSLSHGFNAVLRETGLVMYNGKKRSLTSIRHTYASERIEAGTTAPGLSILAVNMGTSVEMLRKHYAQVFHELEAKLLQKTRMDRT
jgi:integrase